MNILGIDNIVIDVSDLDQARHFYGTILGLTERYAFPDRGVIGYRIGEEQPGLIVRTRSTANHAGGCGPQIWLEVKNAADAAGHLATRGAVPLGPAIKIKTGWVIEVADPFGNVIGLADYTAAPDLARNGQTPNGPSSSTAL